MMIKRGIKRSTLLIVVTTMSMIVLYRLVYKSSPSYIRRERHGEGKTHDHEGLPILALQNCSCYMSYLRGLNKSHDLGGKPNQTSASNSTAVTLVVPNNTSLADSTSGITDEVQHVNKSQETTDQNLEQNSIPEGNTTLIEPTRSRPKYLSEPIDPHNYDYIHNPSSACLHENGTKQDVYLLFVVPIAPANFDRREAIRNSYGKEQNWNRHVPKAVVRTLFMLGATREEHFQKKIDNEAQEFGDVVQETFVDSYLNLTRKTVMAMKWVTEFCRHAKFMMKIDDDTTVNQPRILEILRGSTPVKFTRGHVFMDPIVDRNKKSKFFMAHDYYPNPKFPPYLNGVGYMMSTDVVEAIYRLAVGIPLFPWEDVFVGMCLDKLHVKPQHDPKFMFQGLERNIFGPGGGHLVRGFAIFTNLSKTSVRRIFELLQYPRIN